MPSKGSSRLRMLQAASSTRLLSAAAFLCPWAQLRPCDLTRDGAGLLGAQCFGKHASSSANIWLGRRQQLGAGPWLSPDSSLPPAPAQTQSSCARPALSWGFTGHWAEPRPTQPRTRTNMGDRKDLLVARDLLAWRSPSPRSCCTQKVQEGSVLVPIGHCHVRAKPMSPWTVPRGSEQQMVPVVDPSPAQLEPAQGLRAWRRLLQSLSF